MNNPRKHCTPGSVRDRIATLIASWQPAEQVVSVVLPSIIVPEGSDTYGKIWRLIDEQIEAGAPVVWYVNAFNRTVTIYRPDREPEGFNVTRRLPEHPAMPGFTPTVAELFE